MTCSIVIRNRREEEGVNGKSWCCGNPIFFAAIIVGQVDGRTRKDKWTDGQTEKRKSRQTDRRTEDLRSTWG